MRYQFVRPAVRPASAVENHAQRWCKFCKRVTLNTERKACGRCYTQKGCQTVFCLDCHRCKDCGQDHDPSTKGFDLTKVS